MSSTTLADRFRREEYTGENRCWPCTVLNIVISGGVGVGTAVLATLEVGIAAFALCVSIVYLRGYLVPWTPTISRRYVPKLHSVISTHERAGGARTGLQGLEADKRERTFGLEAPPGEFLAKLGVIQECQNEDDVCLSPQFRTDWYATIETVQDDEGIADSLARFFRVPRSDIGIKTYGDAIEVWVDGAWATSWDTEAGLIADLAAVSALESWCDEWWQLAIDDRGKLAYSLRPFLDTCPLCRGSLTTRRREGEGCCFDREFLTGVCTQCGTQAFDIELLE